MNERPKKWRAAAVPLAALAIAGFSGVFAGSHGGRRLILTEQRVGDAVDAAATPRGSSISTIQILHVTHARGHAAGRALHATVVRRTRAL